MLVEACNRHGRDPRSLRRIYLIGNTQARPLASVAAFAEFAAGYQALGFTDLVFYHPRPDDAFAPRNPSLRTAQRHRAAGNRGVRLT